MSRELSAIVADLEDAEIEPEPSLESANAYAHEDVELDDEQKAAIDRILERD